MDIYKYPLKIDKEVMEEIKKIAEEQGRSVNKQIEYILKEFVKRYNSSKSH